MSFDVDVRRRIGRADVGAQFVADDGVTVLFGPSGAGKTSILNMIAGLLKPDRGHVRIGGETLFDAGDGTDIPAHRRGVGYIFQDGRLFPHYRVRANLLYGHRRAASQEPGVGFDETVAFLGIGDLLDRWPRSLSGGEAQRVAIGRALLSGARALLMDEPLASLDVARRAEILRVIERLRDELRLPILYVTHDPAEAARLATRIVPIERG